MTQGNSTHVNNNLEEQCDSHIEPESNGVTLKDPEAFRTISEVADEIHVPQHVLRFWETRFTQLQPIKRSGGRRYYRVEDIVLLKYISELLYVQGYTIKGVQRLLKEDFSRFNKQDVIEESQELIQEQDHDSEQSVPENQELQQEVGSSVENNVQGVFFYLQEIERLKKENCFLTDSLKNILIELEELKKIIIND